MILYPAIDLRGGRCVRLHQGNFDAETRYSDAPLDVAQSFAADGAAWVHVVDLDGAKDGAARQTDLIASIAQRSGLKVQTGGGLRSADDIARVLESGATRAVVGSVAVKNPALFRQWLTQFGVDRVTLAVDVKIEDQVAYIAASGWQEVTATRLMDLLDGLQDMGALHVLCTDIGRDGVLGGPNIDLYRHLKHRYPAYQIQASGGISSLDDLRALKQDGLAGAITGKAIYEKRFTVKEAVQC
jgi:phosphoribosylformimino-5-aminoimidazole carboxamide ribotide isomerase